MEMEVQELLSGNYNCLAEHPHSLVKNGVVVDRIVFSSCDELEHELTFTTLLRDLNLDAIISNCKYGIGNIGQPWDPITKKFIPVI